MNKPEPPGARRLQVQGSPFEVRKTGVARFDLSDPYHLAVSLSWPGFIAMAMGLMAVINLAFAALYLLEPGSVTNLAAGDVLGAMFFSIETLATVGYGEMAPATDYGHTVAAAEIVTGMAFTAILTGILFVRFSRPKARILFAENAVVARHNGRQTLMIRIANGRMTQLTNASAKLGVLLVETSLEGQMFRRIHDLKLERPTLQMFPLTWTLMHVIDDTSPLADLGPDRVKAQDARLFLSVSARDRSIGAEVQDLYAYDRDHVVFGHRYADALTVDAAGRTLADVSRVGEIEPQPASGGANPG